MDKLVLKGLQFRAFHGVYEEEKKSGNDFEVDLTFHLNLQTSAESDDLKDTLDYSKAYTLVSDVMNSESVDLIETLSYRIGEALFNEFNLSSLVVSVRKLHPPMNGKAEYSEVTLKWPR